MRGYVEKLEREHANHAEGCGCEIEKPGRGQGFEAFMEAEEARMAAVLAVPCLVTAECDCWRCDPDGLPHSGECECDDCCVWYSRQAELEGG